MQPVPDKCGWMPREVCTGHGLRQTTGPRACTGHDWVGTESPVGAGNEAVLAGAMPRAPASTVGLAVDIIAVDVLSNCIKLCFFVLCKAE